MEPLPELINLFSTREQASAFYLLVLFGIVLAVPASRSAIGELVKSFFSLGLLVPVALYAGWCALVLSPFALTPFWGLALGKEALLWFLVPGMSLLFKIGDAGKPRFMRERLVAMVRLDALLVAYLALFPFWLPVELVLQPVATFVVIGLYLAKSPQDKTRANRAAGLLGILLIVATTANVLTGSVVVEGLGIARQLVVPFWLTAFAVPFIYSFALFDAYRSAVRASHNPRAWHLAWWLLRVAGTDVAKLRPLDPRAWHLLGQASSYADVVAAIEDRRSTQQRREDVVRQEAEDLVRYAGIKGTDEYGRQLDRREAKPTIGALRSLGYIQRRLERGRGKYQRRALKMTERMRSELPSEHGIEMRIRRDGRAWYAFRRLPSGQVLGVGARDGEEQLQHYDAPILPKGYPGQAAGWSPLPGDNWY